MAKVSTGKVNGGDLLNLARAYEKFCIISKALKNLPKNIIPNFSKKDLLILSKLQATIEATINDQWQIIKEGSCIGHKYIGLLDTPLKATAVRLIIKEATSAPMIKTFALY